MKNATNRVNLNGARKGEATWVAIIELESGRDFKEVQLTKDKADRKGIKTKRKKKYTLEL